jgi:hypothetical protein
VRPLAARALLGPAGTRIHARVQAAGSWPERFAVLDEETAVYGEGDRVDHARLGWPGGGGIMLGSGEAGIVMELRDTGYGP